MLRIARYIGAHLLLVGLLRIIGIILFKADLWWWSADFKFIFGTYPITASVLFLNLVVALGFMLSGFGLIAQQHWARVGAILFLIFLLPDFPVGTISSIAMIAILLTPQMSKVYGEFIQSAKQFRIAGIIITLIGVMGLMYTTGFGEDIQGDLSYRMYGFPTCNLLPTEKIEITSSELEGENDVIIFLTAPIGTSSIRQQNLVIQDIQYLGGEILGNIYLCRNAIYARMTASEIQQLAQSGNVARIIKNEYVVSPSPSKISDVSCLNDVHGIVDMDKLWNVGLNGDNVAVAVMDTGVNPDIPALQRNGESVVVAEYERYGDYVHWHGTACASCIASQDNTYPGVAPNADIIDVEVFTIIDGESQASYYDILWGFDRIVEWKNSHPDYFVISSNSWGAPCSAIGDGGWSHPSDLTIAANNLAVRYGIPVVAAMGNYQPNYNLEINSPAVGKHVLGVAAVDKSNDWATFSCIGPTPDGHKKPDVCAPGMNINMFGSSGNLITASGTSFSTPITAGIMACIAEDKRDYSADEYYLAFQYSADDVDKPGFDYCTGYGLVDGYGAYEIIGTITTHSGWVTIAFALPFVGIGIALYPEWGSLIIEGEEIWRKKT